MFERRLVQICGSWGALEEHKTASSFVRRTPCVSLVGCPSWVSVCESQRSVWVRSARCKVCVCAGLLVVASMQINGLAAGPTMAAASEPPEPPPRNPDRINASLHKLGESVSTIPLPRYPQLSDTRTFFSPSAPQTRYEFHQTNPHLMFNLIGTHSLLVNRLHASGSDSDSSILPSPLPPLFFGAPLLLARLLFDKNKLKIRHKKESHNLHPSLTNWQLSLGSTSLSPLLFLLPLLSVSRYF